MNEEKSYLGHRVGSVLTSLQDLEGDMENLGTRQLARFGEEIVNQIRKILHSRWNPKYQHQLKELQKIAVAIQKTVEDRGDLKEVLPSASQALQDLSAKLGVKVNNLDAPEAMGGEDIAPQDFQSTGPMPDFGKDQQAPDPNMGQDAQQPPMGQPPMQQPQQMPQPPMPMQ